VISALGDLELLGFGFSSNTIDEATLSGDAA
jgi:hypothetical protein